MPWVATSRSRSAKLLLRSAKDAQPYAIACPNRGPGSTRGRSGERPPRWGSPPPSEPACEPDRRASPGGGRGAGASAPLARLPGRPALGHDRREAHADRSAALGDRLAGDRDRDRDVEVGGGDDFVIGYGGHYSNPI